jgi:hypothetical protein
MNSALQIRIAWIFDVVSDQFPAYTQAIKSLIVTDQTFRELCEEFAEAQQFLKAQSASNPPDRGIETEWSEIVERLSLEILTCIKARQAAMPKV